MIETKQQVALASVAASAGLALSKAAVGIWSGSLAILSEAGHSLIDLMATVLTYFAVRFAGMPADEEHHYGHGKIESISALLVTGLLFVLALIVAWHAGQQLWAREAPSVEAPVWAFAVIIVSIGVDFSRARALRRAARETASPALEADALHFSSDMWSSLAVLVGLIGVKLGMPRADAAAALIVSLFIVLAGARLFRQTIDALIDTAPEGVTERIVALVHRLKGVVAVERVRVRAGGDKVFVDLALGVSRSLPLDQVALIKADVAAAVKGEVPNAEVLVTAEPRALDDESVRERVMVIARNRGLAVHHVIVHAVGGRLTVSLDLEVDGQLELGAAHDIATELEDAIRGDLGPGVEVDTHIEPLQANDQDGEDAAPNRVDAISEALAAFSDQHGTLDDVHNVRVRRTKDGEIVNFHCRVEPQLSVDAVHQRVDQVEHALRERWPSIKRVIGHAEPSLPKIA